MRLQQQISLRSKPNFPLLQSTHRNKSFNDEISCIICQTNLKGAIWLGGINAAQNVRALKKNNISAVLTIAKNSGVQYSPQQNITHRVIQAEDNISYDLSIHFQAISEFIHEQRIRMKNILIHCVAGVSRSITALISYLMIKEFFSLQEALQLCKIHREIVKPNPGFMRQLMILDREMNQSSNNQKSGKKIQFQLNKKELSQENDKDYHQNNNQKDYIKEINYDSSCNTNKDNMQFSIKINSSNQNSRRQENNNQTHNNDNKEAYNIDQNQKQKKTKVNVENQPEEYYNQEEQEQIQQADIDAVPPQRSNLKKKSKVLNQFYSDLCNNQMQMSRSAKPAKINQFNNNQISKNNKKVSNKLVTNQIDDVEDLQQQSLSYLQESNKKSRQERERNKNSLKDIEVEFQRSRHDFENPNTKDELIISQKIQEIQQSKTSLDIFQTKKDQQNLMLAEKKLKDEAEKIEKQKMQQWLKKKQDSEKERIHRNKLEIIQQNEFDQQQRAILKQKFSNSTLFRTQMHFNPYKKEDYINQINNQEQFSSKQNNINLKFTNYNKSSYNSPSNSRGQNQQRWTYKQNQQDNYQEQEPNKKFFYQDNNNKVLNKNSNNIPKYSSQDQLNLQSKKEKQQQFGKTMGYRQVNPSMSFKSYYYDINANNEFGKLPDNVQKDQYLKYDSPKNLLSKLYSNQEKQRKLHFYNYTNYPQSTQQSFNNLDSGGFTQYNSFHKQNQSSRNFSTPHLFNQKNINPHQSKTQSKFFNQQRFSKIPNESGFIPKIQEKNQQQYQTQDTHNQQKRDQQQNSEQFKINFYANP